MHPDVLYAMRIGGFNTRPGFVVCVTDAPSKLNVRTCWMWPGQDEDYLNPHPPVTDDRAKWDDKLATTGEIIEPWADYCAKVKAERQAALAKRDAEEAARQAEIVDLIERTQALRPLIGGFHGYIELSDLEWSFRSDRQHDSRFSARHVLLLLEHVASVTTSSVGVSQ